MMCGQVIFLEKRRKKRKGAKKRGMADKLNPTVVINPGQCTIKNEQEPEKLAAAGRRPKSFCRMRDREWGNAS